MSKWLKRNYPLFVIIGACILIYHFFGEKEDYVSEYNDKIALLEKKVDSLHAENSELENESKLLEEQIAGYDETIRNLNIRINVIKNETKKKVVAVDTFGIDELERFFTERYKHILKGQHENSDN
jgi:chromosome segregation ATPase